MSLPFSPSSFDVVLSMFSLNHLSSEERRIVHLRELLRVLRGKSGGGAEVEGEGEGGILIIFVKAFEHQRKKYKQQDVFKQYRFSRGQELNLKMEDKKEKEKEKEVEEVEQNHSPRCFGTETDFIEEVSDTSSLLSRSSPSSSSSSESPSISSSSLSSSKSSNSMGSLDSVQVFFHLFREGEIATLLKKTAMIGYRIVSEGKDEAKNCWFAVISKK